MDNYIINFWLDLNESAIKKMNLISLILETKDYKEIKVDFIKMDRQDYYWITNSTDTEECLDIINKIYRQHILYKITGTFYPIYCINTTNPKGYINIAVALKGFKGTNNITEFKVPEFVDEIDLVYAWDTQIVMNRLERFVLNDNVILKSIHNIYKLKIENIENISEIELYVLGIIINQIVESGNDTLKFNCINSLPSMCFGSQNKIKHLILEDECTIENVDISLLYDIGPLESIRLCKSLKTISSKPIENYIRKINGCNYLVLNGNEYFSMVGIRIIN